MRKQQKQKVMAIAALCISILGLTLGFAAFSNTLTISSSATVTPDSSDFKMRAYGTLESGSSFIEDYTLTNKTVPSVYSDSVPYAMSDAVISEDGLTISNISATFKNVGESAYYTFAIKNEGKYDAYLDITDYLEQEGGSKPDVVKCTARPGTRQDLVDQTCENIVYIMELADADGNYISVDINESYYRVIPAGSYIYLGVILEYLDVVDVYADGDFDVSIDDFTLNFSTVKPSK